MYPAVFCKEFRSYGIERSASYPRAKHRHPDGSRNEVGELKTGTIGFFASEHELEIHLLTFYLEKSAMQSR